MLGVFKGPVVFISRKQIEMAGGEWLYQKVMLLHRFGLLMQKLNNLCENAKYF